MHDEDKRPVSIRWFERSASEGPYTGSTTAFEGFDGNSFIAGKNTWQICDISDPLLQNLIADSPLPRGRVTFRPKDGLPMVLGQRYEVS